MYHCDLRALPSFLNWVSGKQGVVWVVILQKFVADVAFIHTVCSRSFPVRQGWNFAQGIQLEKPFWLFVKLVPQARLGVFDSHLMQSVLDALLIESYPGALGKRAKPVLRPMKSCEETCQQLLLAKAKPLQHVVFIELACKLGSVPSRQ